PAPTPADPTPPRAFTQGVGTVFQVVGVLVFLTMFISCCGSGLLTREWATQPHFSSDGFRLSPNKPPTYSVGRAVTICVFCGVFFGLACAAVGLGLQAEHRRAPAGAVVITALAALFSLAHAWFAIVYIHSAFIIVLLVVASVTFLVLFGLALGASREMSRNPPPPGHEVLPADYKIPYSHYHDDPPEVRLAAELDQRRQRLAVQQKELEMLEEKLKRKLDEASGD
ncbi:MAG: hypothetical protein M3478_00905, partial [Planctomycetota bacterium]|nr:hypothetical protein [Planctomycetota bacterium]